ncbi:NAD-dependent epimerase/dehydratase family protein [uncultured Pseudacidovorax sp.]|uniref:NAD-dependent epimerase/dehydratase family protein n=1 Tax=uncultured Pseudacidovorax sp. TaxID=679313 RepID=UPI0025CF8B35|nr:NAD-dependent epimerase/dehydratase family protein [uncultured Pseudacidovorax sp.]
MPLSNSITPAARGRIVVAGASGYLGSRLVKRFSANGYEVVALVRSRNSLGHLKGMTGDFLVEEIRSEMSDNFSSQNCEAAFNCVASYGRRSESIGEIISANTIFAANFFRAAAGSTARRIYQIGSALPPEINAYSLTKSHAFDWLRLTATSAPEKQFIHLKVQQFYGPGEEEDKLITYLLNQLGTGGPPLKLTDGTQRRDVIYIEDLLSAIETIFEKYGKFGLTEFELGSGQSIAVRDIVLEVAKAIQSNRKLDFGSITRRAGEPENLCANITALRDLGWAPKWSLTEALVEMTASLSPEKPA